jgi:purine-binding chemotaxis protein CheW
MSATNTTNAIRRSAGEVLRDRARLFAAIPPAADAAGPAIAVVEFGPAHERYAIEMSYVTKIDPLDQLTPLPCTPAFFRGVINVRGRIVAVIDLKKFFDLPDQGITDLHRAIIVRQGDVELAILADYVAGTRDVALSSLQPPLPTLTGIRAEYLKGVTAERIVVLDAARILSDPKLIVDEELKR